MACIGQKRHLCAGEGGACATEQSRAHKTATQGGRANLTERQVNILVHKSQREQKAADMLELVVLEELVAELFCCLARHVCSWVSGSDECAERH